MAVKMRTTTPITTVVGGLSVVIILSLMVVALRTDGISAAAAPVEPNRHRSPMVNFEDYQDYQRAKKLAADQRLAELQAIIAMSNDGGGFGHGHIDPFAAGRRRRSPVDSLYIDEGLPLMVGEPTRTGYQANAEKFSFGDEQRLPAGSESTTNIESSDAM